MRLAVGLQEDGGLGAAGLPVGGHPVEHDLAQVILLPDAEGHRVPDAPGMPLRVEEADVAHPAQADMPEGELAGCGDLVVEGQGLAQRHRVERLTAGVLDPPADFARPAAGEVRAAPAEVLDDLRHVGPDDAVLIVVPAGVAGEVLADLHELPAGGGNGQSEDQGQRSGERSHGGLLGREIEGAMDGQAHPPHAVTTTSPNRGLDSRWRCASTISSSGIVLATIGQRLPSARPLLMNAWTLSRCAGRSRS